MLDGIAKVKMKDPGDDKSDSLMAGWDETKSRKEENQGHNLYFKAAVLEVVQSAEAIRLPPDEDSRHNMWFGRYCLNRHAYTIDVCFMNASVSRVRLKSLWGFGVAPRIRYGRPAADMAWMDGRPAGFVAKLDYSGSMSRLFIGVGRWAES